MLAIAILAVLAACDPTSRQPSSPGFRAPAETTDAQYGERRDASRPAPAIASVVAPALDTSTPADFRVDPFRAYSLAVEGGGVADSVAVGDVNGDRLVDVAVSTVGSEYPGPETVRVFLQQKNGELAAPIAVGYTQMTPWSGIAMSDLNNDGVCEIIVGHAPGYGGGITVMRWDNGRFVATQFEGTRSAQDIGVLDLNGDGARDVFAQSWSDGAEVYLGNGRGGFYDIRQVSNSAMGYNSLSGDVDFSGDGLGDIAVISGQGSSLLWVYPAKRSEALAAPIEYDFNSMLRYGAMGLALSDLDKDGRVDLLLAVRGQENSVPYGIQILERGAGNTLTAGPLLPSAHELPEGIAVRDLDGNGLPDIVTMHGGWNDMGYFLQRAGGFDPEVVRVTSDTPWFNAHYRNNSVATGDVNGDGCADIVIADPATNSLVVLAVRNCRKIQPVLPREPKPNGP